jgi:hypothetical protein
MSNVFQVYWRHENSLIAAWTERELLERNEPVGQLSADVWSEVLVNVIGMRPEVWLALLPLLGGAVDQKTHATKAGVFVNYRQQVRLFFFGFVAVVFVRRSAYLLLLWDVDCLGTFHWERVPKNSPNGSRLDREAVRGRRSDCSNLQRPGFHRGKFSID